MIHADLNDKVNAMCQMTYFHLISNRKLESLIGDALRLLFHSCLPWW